MSGRTDRREAPFLSSRCVAIALAAACLASCSLSKDLATARQAVDGFHQKLMKAQDDAIYDGAHASYRSTVSRETNRGLFARIRRKMGAFADSTNTQYLTNASTSGTFVTLHYTTKCANGDLEEQFVWRVDAGEARLVSYRANSPLLLTD